ncbi:hypothetical protein [Microbulbifer sp. VAAF005]|uniref:hypothetical protein n=1 Tax=Microbulbifer sp. VAAF005 TaxID=3034230 RepID=UPI0024AE4C16|nr:hypothetical protein [Microbulbifer sp. VAAF005]WHI45583.1 hypothetical protein P0078_17890 [Microbulbifer sp. VAAF005]
MKVFGSGLAASPAMEVHGFKAMGDNSNGYLLISDAKDGRKVYIAAAIAGKFASWLARSGYKGSMVMSRLAQLRATAGGFKSYNNAHNAFEHMDIIENLQIGYKIVQPSADNRRGGVYITRIDFAEHAGGDVTPGLYHVDYKAGEKEWALDKDEQPKIRRTNMAVNGLCRHAEVAARDIIPGMVNGAYKDVSGSQGIKDEGFGLFYNPRPLYSAGQQWKTPQQKQVSFDVTANKLGNLILASQKEGRDTQWVIHGDGCHLFRKTLLRLQGQVLDKHTVFFAAPKGSLQTLLPLVRGAGLKLHKDVFKYHPHDWSQPLNRVNPRISKEIKAFGSDYDNAARVASLNVQSSFAMAAGYVGSFALGGFTLGLGELSAGAGGVGMAVKARALRNMLANHANDPTLNPHMHPFKSVNEMNAHVISENGSGASSFLKLAGSLRREYAR